jgi:Transposase DDE domain.
LKEDGVTKEEQLYEWFGFKLHLAVDTETQLPVNYELTKGNISDTSQFLPLIEGMDEDLLGRCEKAYADMAYDNVKNIEYSALRERCGEIKHM